MTVWEGLVDQAFVSFMSNVNLVFQVPRHCYHYHCINSLHLSLRHRTYQNLRPAGFNGGGLTLRMAAKDDVLYRRNKGVEAVGKDRQAQIGGSHAQLN
jgi:hypothetical protein